MDARLAAYEAKDARLRALIVERKLQIVPADFDRLVQAALDAGFDAYYAPRRFGNSREEFTARQAMIAASFNPEPTEIVGLARSLPMVRANSRSCAMEYGLGCNNLGSMYQQGQGVTRDEGKAFELYAKACTLRTGVGCRNVGILHADAVTLPHDRALAVAEFAKGCRFGDLDSCNKQAWHLEQGLGTPRNIDEA